MSNYELGIRIRSDFRQHHTEALKSANRQKALNTVMRQGLQAGKQGAQGLRELETSARSSSNALRHMSHVAGGAWAGLQLVEKAKEASRTAAEIQNIRTRIEGLTASSSDYANVENYLVELSDRHHKSLLALSDSYSKVLVLEESGILTRKESQLITEGFSNAQSKAGATTEQLKQSLFGMTQGLTAGTLRAEELNQVTEPLPGLLQQLDKAAGLTAGGFRQMVVDGKITSEFFKSTLIKAFESYEGAAERTAGNISAAHADHENSYLKLVKAYETPISDSTKLVLSASSAVMETFAENAENVGTIMEIAVVLGMAHAAKATASYTATKISSIQASKTQQLATIAEAKAIQQKAVSLHNSAIQEQAGLKRAIALNKNTQMRTVLLRKLAVVNQQVFATENALAASRVRLTAVTARATVVARGFAAASSLIGGLPGILTIAAIAMMSYASSTDEATAKAKELNEQNDKLNPFNNFSLRRAENALTIYEQRLILAQQVAKETGEKFKNDFWGVTVGEVDKADNKVLELQKNIAALKAIIDKSKAKPTDNNEGDAAANKSAEKLLNNLKKQVEVYGAVSQEAKVRYDIEKGALVNIKQETKDLLIAQAKLLDAKKEQSDIDKKNSSVTEESKSLLANMREQAATHGKTSNEAKIRYQLEHGNLVAINDDIKQQLILEAQLLDKKKAASDQQTQFKAVRSSLLTPEQKEKQTHNSNLDVLNGALGGETDVAKRQQINQLIEAEQQRHTDALAIINQKGASDFDALWGNTFDRFAAGIGESTSTALLESESFGEGMKEVTKGAIKSVVAGLVEIGVKKAAMWAYDLAMGQSTIAANTAAGVTSATVLAAAYAPAAAGATLATLGTNGIPASATLTANYGLASTLALSGIAHNGLRKNYDEGTYVIRRDEMMMNPQQRDNFEVLLKYVNQNQQQFGSKQQARNSAPIQFGDTHLSVAGDNSTPENQAKNAQAMYNQFVNKVVSDIDRQGPIGRMIQKRRA